MKLNQSILTAGIASVLCASAAQADVTVYITGATAFRSPAVTAIQNYLTGGYVGIYGAKSGVTDAQGASNCAFRGTRTANPALGIITIKCAWGGSAGGVRLIQASTTLNINNQPGVPGWIPDAALPPGSSGGSIFAGTETTTGTTLVTGTIIGADTTTYTFEATPKPDAAFTDAFQGSAIVSSGGTGTGTAVSCVTGDPDGKVGVIPFDLVVCNGVDKTTVTKYTGVTYGSGVSSINYTAKSGDTTAANIGRTIAGTGIQPGTTITADSGTALTISLPTTAVNTGNPAATNISSANPAGVAPFSNITSNQLRAVLTSTGRLAQFTGLASDNAFGVYAYGRNADSGTRISQIAEANMALSARPGFHLVPTFTPAGGSLGSGGTPGNVVATLARWGTETVLGTFYSSGQGGFSSGGTIADALLAPGSTVATASAPLTRPGWTIGYLGRSDASRACASTFGVNTAKRLTFNGQQDWVGSGSANTVTGAPSGGFDDAQIREGRYLGWEFEHFYRKASASADAITVLESLAASLLGTAPSGSVALDASFHVTKGVEGGPVIESGTLP